MKQVTAWYLFLWTLPLLAAAQEPARQRPSPLAMATARYKDAYLKITYSQPQKRRREIFGNLVPYGAVWRTGANEATEITLTRDVVMNQTLLPAGTYSLFTIPGKDAWTIIVNRDVGLWGAYNYNEKTDVMRFQVTPSTTAATYESFTIEVEQRNNMADILLIWDRTKVTIPIQFLEPKQP
jgi:hypothetical protein